MARNRGNTKLTSDPLVKRLIQDPARIPRLVAVAGWVGRADNKSTVRLYLTPNLGTYLEVDGGDIVDAVKLDEMPLGGTMLWLARDATVRLYSNEGPAPGAAGYLQGRITDLPIPGVPSDPFPPTWTPRCLQSQFPKTWLTALCQK